jgi:hypothetical protein
VSRSLQNNSLSNPAPRSFDANHPSSPDASRCSSNPHAPVLSQLGSRITALNIEFVAKPNEAHKIHAALPAAIDGALGSVAGFAGSFVMIANYEARLVTVVTLWIGEDRAQRCAENVRWVRALVAPYLDRCLRVQTLAAYVPSAAQTSPRFESSCSEEPFETAVRDEQAMCAA